MKGTFGYIPARAHRMHSSTVKICMKAMDIQKNCMGFPWYTMLGIQVHIVATAWEPVSRRIAKITWNLMKWGDHFRLTTKKYTVINITSNSHPGSSVMVSMKV